MTRYKKMRTLGDPRFHIQGANIYMIRDRWKKGKYLTELDRCEYAVWKDGAIEWKPCEEGTLLSKIEPFGIVKGMNTATGTVNTGTGTGASS